MFRPRTYKIPDFNKMSYMCCKGLYTRPCAGCDKQLCVARGHNQYADYSEKFLCHSCEALRLVEHLRKGRPFLCGFTSCFEVKCNHCDKMYCGAPHSSECYIDEKTKTYRCDKCQQNMYACGLCGKEYFDENGCEKYAFGINPQRCNDC